MPVPIKIEMETGNPQSSPGEVSRVVELLGGDLVLHRQVVTSFDAHEALLAGLPGAALTHLMDRLSVVNQETFLGEGVGISARTVQRKQKSLGALDLEQSRRLWKFAQILSKATNIFGSQEEAEQWLLRPALALEQNRPIDLLATPAGEALVEDLLGRIEYGVYV